PARGLCQNIGRAPKEGRENDEDKRPEARAGKPRRADHGDAGEGDETAEDLRPSRVFAQEEPRQRNGEKSLRLDDERGEPDRKALVDRNEQQAELSDTEQEPIEGDPPRRSLRRTDEEDRGKRGENEAQRREHQRRGLRHADLDGDEGQAPDDRDADRRQDVARGHAKADGRAAGTLSASGERHDEHYRRCARRAPFKKRRRRLHRPQVEKTRLAGLRLSAAAPDEGTAGWGREEQDGPTASPDLPIRSECEFLLAALR